MTSDLNNYFDKIFVINLKSRVDRRLRIIRKLSEQNIQFDFFEAIDGYSPELVSEFNRYFSQPISAKNSHPLEKKYGRKLIQSSGALGYLKTYEMVLSLSQEKGFKKILCFDDDILFHKSFNKEFEKFIPKIHAEWKLLFLGATQHVWNIPKSHKYSNEELGEFSPEEDFYHPLITDGSFAVGIDCSVYQILLKEIEKYNAPLDSGPLRTVMSQYQNQCFVAQPNLVIADVSESDIGLNRNQYELAEKVKWDLQLYNFPDKEILVTVIIAAYNAEKTISKSIKSILNQTHQNIELIVADDGSNDKTVDFVKKLQTEDKRIRLQENDLNRGCYYVRNDALKIAKGEIIAIQDADDIALPDRIEKQLIPILAKEAKFTISRIYRSRCSVEELDIENPEEMMALVEERRVKNKYGNYDYRDRKILGFNTSVFHRSLFEELGLFWENRFASDAEYAERILYHYADIRLKGNENIHSFLMDCEPIKGLYKRVEDVLVVSTDMGETNITNKHKQQEKKDFETLWRKRLNNEVEYQYPKFESAKKSISNTSITDTDKLSIKFNIYQQKVEAKEQMLNASRKQKKNLENDLAWYARTYDHLPKWYLKIGGIFRRWPFK